MKSVLIVGYGVLAERLAERLRCTFYVDFVPDDKALLLLSFAPRIAAVIVVTPRCAPLLLNHMNQLLCRAVTPAIVIQDESPVLRIGPVVLPSQTPCLECWIERQRREPNGALNLRVGRLYEQREEMPPRGIIPSDVRIVSARIGQMISDHDRGHLRAGDMWNWNSFTLDGRSLRLAGIPECHTCLTSQSKMTTHDDHLLTMRTSSSGRVSI